MVRYQQIGHTPELYRILQQIVAERYPYEMYRDDHPLFEHEAKQNRDQYRKQLIAALVGIDDLGRGPDLLPEDVEALYEAIDDDDLRALIEFGTLDELHFDHHGHYLAIIS